MTRLIESNLVALNCKNLQNNPSIPQGKKFYNAGRLWSTNKTVVIVKQRQVLRHYVKYGH